MKKGTEFLKKKGLIHPTKNKFIIRFGNDKMIDLASLLDEFGKEVLTDMQERKKALVDVLENAGNRAIMCETALKMVNKAFEEDE